VLNVSHPLLIVEIIDKVFAKYYTNVVEFKSLSCIDASNLIYTVWIISPEPLFWYVGGESTRA
jgi:hypothetical protein